MSSDFKRRCTSALTHPLTIAALLALLLNDVVLKSLWPDHWVTGKLSDLAWVMFAPPLLAFLLSFFTRRNQWAERGVFGTAYIGLPLLYAVFNTFESLHDWILRGLLWFTNGAAGSPLDPADSLVIPAGLAVALWIWKRPPVGSESLRMRLRMHTAVVALLATVASTVAEPSPTAWLAGIAGDGTVVMEGPHLDYYASSDGGLTWSNVEEIDRDAGIEWGGREVETSRGKYLIEGSDILLVVPGGEPKIVYSVSYLREKSNTWARGYAARRLHNLSGIYDDPGLLDATEPVNIVYDQRTGNVVVAMTLEGALAGNSDEEWERVAVGNFTPTDFSFWGKARLMFSRYFWLATLAFSLSLIAVALSLSERAMPPSGPPSRFTRVYRRVTGISLLFVVFAEAAAFAAAFAFAFGAYNVEFTLIPIIFLLLLPVFALGRPRQSPVRKLIAMIFAVVGIVLASGVFPPFGGEPGNLLYLEAYFTPFFAIGGVAFASIAALIYFPQLRQLTACGVALLPMGGFIILTFTMWLAGGLTLAWATIAAFVLMALTVYMLRRHLIRQASAAET